MPVLTITADNGKEFADHVRVAEKLGADFYFAKPYHSWERGLNEHTNGLVQGYLPKDTDFLEVSDEEVQRVQDLFNSRPRKVPGYRQRLCSVATCNQPESVASVLIADIA